jgi:EipB-like
MNERWKSGGLTAVMLFISAMACYAAMPVPQPPAQPGALSSTALAPHRAIYDMSLVRAAAGANVGEVRGRLVFDFTGSGCEGYTLNTRLVTDIIDRDGKSTVTDLRSTTWEHAKGDKFRFNSSQYLNQRLSEQVAGLASRGRDGGNVSIALEKPKKRQVRIAGASMFPTQHSLAILDAAQSGRGVVQADIYDGSEKGEKYYETTTFIGKPVPPGGAAAGGLKPIANAERLDGLVSWPVSISYYETQPGKKAHDEGTPTYELSFRLYANGVSRKLMIDYGTFSIAGELSRIDFLEPGKCTDAKAEKRP